MEPLILSTTHELRWHVASQKSFDPSVSLKASSLISGSPELKADLLVKVLFVGQVGSIHQADLMDNALVRFHELDKRSFMASLLVH